MDTTKLLVAALKKLPAPKEHPEDRIKIQISPEELENQDEAAAHLQPDATDLGYSSHEIEFFKKEQDGEVIWQVGNIV